MFAMPALLVVTRIVMMWRRILDMRAALVDAAQGDRPEDLDGPDLVHRYLKYMPVLDRAPRMLEECRELGMLEAR